MPLLVAYCRAVCRAETLAKLVDGFEAQWLTDDAGLKRYEHLRKMATDEEKHAASLATKLRLTPQSRYTPQAAATADKKAGAARPWNRVIANE